MADVFSTTTTHTKFIPEVWSKDAQIARQSTLVMADLVTRYDFDVANYGSKINIPFVSNLVGGDISTATGQLDAEAPTEGEIELVVNKWKGVRMKVLDLVLAQSKYPFRKLYMDRMGYRLGQFLEQDLTALAPALSQTVGTFGVDLIDGNYRRAVQYLDDARVPFADRHLLLSPAQKNAILGIDKFIRYDATGERSMVEIGKVPGEIYGALTHVSPETFIAGGTDTSNMLFHRAAFAAAVQNGIKLEQFAKVGWLDDLGGSHLYGVVELRDDHGVELRS